MNNTQTARTGSPVINFANAATKEKRRPGPHKGKRPIHPDADLIEHCIEYAMQIKGTQVAYEVDSTVANSFAAFFDDLARSRADRALRDIMELPPTTLDGLSAKASLVAMSVEDWASDIDEMRRNFLISLADDVARFQRASREFRQSHIVITVQT